MEDIKRLEARFCVLEADCDREQQAQSRREEIFLLGQSAYVLCQLVEDAVFQGEATDELQPLSLTQLSVDTQKVH